MFDTIVGLPVHILVIHAVVVLGPLAAIALMVYACVESRRSLMKWPTVILALVTGIFGFIAAESGEALERRVKMLRGSDADFMNRLHEHTEAGDAAKLVCLGFMILALLVVFLLLPLDKPAVGGRPVGIVVMAVSVIVSLMTMGAIIRTGHTGSGAGWSEVSKVQLPSGGDDKD